MSAYVGTNRARHLVRGRTHHDLHGIRGRADDPVRAQLFQFPGSDPRFIGYDET
jgi:hypothetical protein